MGVKIVRDTFRARLNRLEKTMAIKGKPDIPLKEIEIQWRAENTRRFTKESYAEYLGGVKKWDKFKDSTKFHMSNGKKVYNKRPSGRKYSESSKLLQDTGRLRQSIMSGQHTDSISVLNRTGLTIGSKVKYAQKHHYGVGKGLPKRPIITISKSDRLKFRRIFVKWLKGEF